MSSFESASLDPDEVAAEVLASLDRRGQIAPLTDRHSHLDLSSAYRVAAAVRRLREARGERVVGREIGFTNATIWTEFAVNAPMWDYVYESSRHDLTALVGSSDRRRNVETPLPGGPACHISRYGRLAPKLLTDPNRDALAA
jgi:hypothetical protein